MGHFGAGITFLYLLVVAALAAAKLAGFIHVGWLLILSPVWAPVVIVILVALFIAVDCACAESRGENPFE